MFGQRLRMQRALTHAEEPTVDEFLSSLSGQEKKLLISRFLSSLTSDDDSDQCISTKFDNIILNSYFGQDRTHLDANTITNDTNKCILLKKLPKSVLCHVISFLNCNDRTQCCQVSWHFNDACNEPIAKRHLYLSPKTLNLSQEKFEKIDKSAFNNTGHLCIQYDGRLFKPQKNTLNYKQVFHNILQNSPKLDTIERRFKLFDYHNEEWPEWTELNESKDPLWYALSRTSIEYRKNITTLIWHCGPANTKVGETGEFYSTRGASLGACFDKICQLLPYISKLVLNGNSVDSASWGMFRHRQPDDMSSIVNDMTKHMILNQDYARNLRYLDIDLRYDTNWNKKDSFVIYYLKNCVNLEDLRLKLALPGLIEMESIELDKFNKIVNNNINSIPSGLKSLHLKFFIHTCFQQVNWLGGTNQIKLLDCARHPTHHNVVGGTHINAFGSFIVTCTDYLIHNLSCNNSLRSFSIETPKRIRKNEEFITSIFSMANNASGGGLEYFHLSLHSTEIQHLLHNFGNIQHKLNLEEISLYVTFDSKDLDGSIDDVVQIIHLSNRKHLSTYESLKLELTGKEGCRIDLYLCGLLNKLVETKDGFSLHSLSVKVDGAAFYSKSHVKEVVSLLTKVTHQTSLKSISISPLNNLDQDEAEFLKFWFKEPFGECQVPTYDEKGKVLLQKKKHVSVACFDSK